MVEYTEPNMNVVGASRAVRVPWQDDKLKDTSVVTSHTPTDQERLYRLCSAPPLNPGEVFMRMSFDQLFERTAAVGMISPRVPVQIGDVTMTPGVPFGGGVNVGGVDLIQLMGKDFDVEVEDGVHLIKGAYD